MGLATTPPWLFCLPGRGRRAPRWFRPCQRPREELKQHGSVAAEEGTALHHLAVVGEGRR